MTARRSSPLKRRPTMPLDMRGDAHEPEGAKIYTVTEITREVKKRIESAFAEAWVVGEASNVRQPSSGHVYLTLKDEKCQLRTVVFRNVAVRLPFDLRDGMEITVFGRLTVYEPRGDYQIIAERVEPKGMGALQLAFLQLKEKLEREGLFDAARKKPIPFMPSRIGIVTSPTGAAIRDMLDVILRRFPAAEVFLYPVRVQGEGSADEIAHAVECLNRWRNVDVLIVGRGGGSLEDLWAFNEERVARAIFHSDIPIISAVGHEIDVTISDLVADHRALTPTAAGEAVVPDRAQLLADLVKLRNRLAQSLSARLTQARARLEALGRSYGLRRPMDRIRQRQQHLDDQAQRLHTSAQHVLGLRREQLATVGGKLEALSPLRVLARGYGIVTRADDPSPLCYASALGPGDRVRARLHRGSFEAQVNQIDPTPGGP